MAVAVCLAFDAMLDLLLDKVVYSMKPDPCSDKTLRFDDALMASMG